jgi:hypothetical protein
MRRGILYIAIIALAVLTLSGCGFVISLVLESDLTVENIEITEDSSGYIIGTRITIANYGGNAEDVEFSIYLSYSSSVNPATDFLIYTGNAGDIDWNDEEVVPLSVENDINPYIQQNDLFVPEGEFYFGVFVDPDDRIEEGDETDNDGTAGPYFFGGGGTADLDPDPYEYDDEPANAFPLNYITDLPTDQFRNFHYQGDVDYLEVFLQFDDHLYVETFSSGGIEGDTFLVLLDSALNEVASNDDFNGLYSAIDFVAPFADTYYIVVKELFDNQAEYGLHISK